MKTVVFRALFPLGMLVYSVTTLATDDALRWDLEAKEAVARAKDFKERLKREAETAPLVEKDRLRILKNRRDEAVEHEKARQHFVRHRAQQVDESTRNDQVEREDEIRQKQVEQKYEEFRNIYTKARDKYITTLNGPGYIDPFVEEGLENLPEIFKNEKRNEPKSRSKAF